MRHKLAIAATLIAAVVPLPSYAAPNRAPAVPTYDDSAMWEISRDVAFGEPEPARKVRSELEEPVPYRLDCTVTEWTGDPSNSTTTQQTTEGMLEDEPFHFEVESYLIRDESGTRGRGHDCTFTLGEGPDDPHPFPLLPVPAAATLASNGHGHTMVHYADGNRRGMAGAFGWRAFLRRGHSITFDLEADATSTRDDPGFHIARCEGFTVVRGYRAFPDAWCEHQLPSAWRNSKPDDDTTHDGPTDTLTEAPLSAELNAIADATTPSDLPADVPPVNVPPVAIPPVAAIPAIEPETSAAVELIEKARPVGVSPSSGERIGAGEEI